MARRLRYVFFVLALVALSAAFVRDLVIVFEPGGLPLGGRWLAPPWAWGVFAAHWLCPLRGRHVKSRGLRRFVLFWIAGILIFIDIRAAIALNPIISALVGLVCGRFLWPRPRPHTTPSHDRWGWA